jgi:hypothetical protein
VKKIKTAVLLFEEAVLPIVSAVSDMNRNTGQHDPSAPRHACKTAQTAAPLTENVVCP